MSDTEDSQEGGAAPQEGSGGETGERMDLPKWNRARVKRKAVAGQEQDAFQGSLRDAGRAAKRQAPLVIGGVVALGLLIGGGVWFFQSRTETKAEATRLLAEAAGLESRAQVGDAKAIFGDRTRPPPVPIVASEAERDEKIATALEALEQEQGGSKAALAAELVRAAEAIEVSDFDTAKAAYQRFLDDAPEDHALLFLGREGLGIAREGAGDLEGALTVYRELAKQKGAFYRDQALAHQGRVLEALGKKDEALEVYRTYLEEYPFSDPSLAREFVRDRMLELDPASVPDVLSKDASGLNVADMPGKAPGGA